jgi:hypothetical protein
VSYALTGKIRNSSELRSSTATVNRSVECAGVDAAHRIDHPIARNMGVARQKVVGPLRQDSSHIGRHVSVHHADAFPGEFDDSTPSEARRAEFNRRLL